MGFHAIINMVLEMFSTPIALFDLYDEISEQLTKRKWLLESTWIYQSLLTL